MIVSTSVASRLASLFHLECLLSVDVGGSTDLEMSFSMKVSGSTDLKKVSYKKIDIIFSVWRWEVE